jgi:hypothetical protein
VDRLTVAPGRPPPILINETYAACGTASAGDDVDLRVTPYLAVPDPADCSAFWLRICLAEAPSLTYVLCPGEAKYFSDKKSLTCYNQASASQHTRTRPFPIPHIPYTDKAFGQHTTKYLLFIFYN